jgi:hypothetical protein
MNEEIIEERYQWIFDEITGVKKKIAISSLNKRKISKYELDELFASE